MQSFSLIVPQDFVAKERLDTYLARTVTGMNRSKLRSGLVSLSVNGEPVKPSRKVGAGDAVRFSWESAVPSHITPEDIPLDVLYEDGDVTVINKKQGMVTHPASGNWSGTLVNALLFRWRRAAVEALAEDGSMAALRPGIVHRLDKDTSGVIITARSRKAEEWLQRQFRQRALGKTYIAIAVGKPRACCGEIRSRITRDSRDRKRFRVTEQPSVGKAACTSYRCIASYRRGREVYSLFVLRLHTGRTHQIRVHLKHIGCPILGDPIYGTPTTGTTFAGATLMLHARRLRVRLPGRQEYAVFTAPVPPRFLKVLRVLHRDFTRDEPPLDAPVTAGDAHGRC